jgi:hypothetical protein
MKRIVSFVVALLGPIALAFAVGFIAALLLGPAASVPAIILFVAGEFLIHRRKEQRTLRGSPSVTPGGIAIVPPPIDKPPGLAARLTNTLRGLRELAATSQFAYALLALAILGVASNFGSVAHLAGYSSDAEEKVRLDGCINDHPFDDSNPCNGEELRHFVTVWTRSLENGERNGEKFGATKRDRAWINALQMTCLGEDYFHDVASQMIDEVSVKEVVQTVRQIDGVLGHFDTACYLILGNLLDQDGDGGLFGSAPPTIPDGCSQAIQNNHYQATHAAARKVKYKYC